jgi:hypothetical protein
MTLNPARAETSDAMEWWNRIEARDRVIAEDNSRKLEHLKTLQRQRQERENREQVSAWEAQQARERAERERAAEENEQIRREMAERETAQREKREREKREAAERARELPVGMPSGWRPPTLR